MFSDKLSTSDLWYEEEIPVGGYDVGQDRKMLLPRVVEALHEASTRQVLLLGLSAVDLDPFHLTWVMVRQQLHIDKLPTMGDKVKVTTYPSGKDRLYTYRDFSMLSEDGDTLARCTSTWILMNTKTRSIGKYPPAIAELLESTDRFPHLPRCDKLRINLGEESLNSTRIAKWHDLDFNGHVSTPNYYSWMLDAVPISVHLKRPLISIQVNIRGEIRMGECVKVFVREVKENAFEHVMTGSDGIAAVGRSEWHSAPDRI